jgi:hypothetical protein
VSCDDVACRLGALSGIDGAVLLNRDLALVAFGVILPVGHVVPIERAIDSVGGRPRVLPVSRRVLAPRTAVAARTITRAWLTRALRGTTRAYRFTGIVHWSGTVSGR